MDRKEDRREGVSGAIQDIAPQRSPLDQIEEHLEGLGTALRQDQTFDDLKTSAICLCNVMQNLVAYLKERDR